ncbi:MAG: MMPL family transporter [Proteobacteria bacterium]|nr:MMPL family transporter [Pseudomonadota bacterium]
MTRYIRFVLAFRLWIVLAFAAATIFFGWYFAKVTISSTPGELFFSGKSRYQEYLYRMEDYGGDAIAIFGISGDVLSPDVLSRVRAVTDELEKDPEIRRVESLASAQHIEGKGDELIIERYADILIEDPGRRDELLAEITTDSLTRGWLVTPDGKNSILVVELESGERGMETSPKTVKRVLEVFSDKGFDVKEIHRGGLVAVLGQMMTESMFTLRVILPITALVLFLSVWVMFHRFWPVVITLIITSMAITWTMGLAVLLYGHINVVTTMVPGLVLITCFADVLHLCSSYLLELSKGLKKREAILAMGTEVGTACGYTSITTFFGFMSMTLVPTPIFKQLGLLMGFGVSVALFMALTLVPVFLSCIPQPKPWRTGSAGTAQGLLDSVLSLCARLATGWPKTVNLVFFAVMALSFYGFSHIHFEAQFSERFDDDNIIQQSQRFFKQTFPGTNPLDVYLETDEAEAMLDPERFAEIAAFESWIESIPRVTGAVSVVDLVRKMYREINPEMAAQSPLPDNRQALAQLLLLFEMSGGEELGRFVDPGHRTVRLSVRMEDMGVIEAAEVGTKIREEAAKRFPGQIRCETFSMESLIGEWVHQIIIGQRNGLLFALVTVAAFMILATRSFKIGLISMFPNVLPLLVLLGYTGWFWDIVDTDAMGVLMVAIGIGVDDTIHFLMRFKFESAKTPDVNRAVNQAFHYSGRAIIITSVILVAGFAPFGTSDYFSVKIFGTLLPVALFTALAADLLWVPAMVRLGWIRFPGVAPPFSKGGRGDSFERQKRPGRRCASPAGGSTYKSTPRPRPACAPCPRHPQAAGNIRASRG